MKIEWNKITWYSKILAVVLIVLTFCLGSYLGSEWMKERGEMIAVNDKDTQKEVENSNKITIDTRDIKEENFTGTVPVISGSGLVVIQVKEYIQLTIDNFRKEANADVPNLRKEFGADSPSAEYDIGIDAQYLKSHSTESIVMSIYTFTGGAHGSTYYKVITTSNGESSARVLSLADIIVRDKQSAFTDFVKKQLLDQQSSDYDPSGIFEDAIKALKFDSFTNWSLDDKNLVIYFDQYEIGPGVLGAVAFPLPINKIKSFLDSDYL